MPPKPSAPESSHLFVSRLDERIDMKHPLVRLAGVIDWAEIERTFSVSFTSTRGRPALPPRLVAGLLYLQHTFKASDEAVVNTWLENPYWQYFCGQTYLQTELPIDPSSLTRWRKAALLHVGIVLDGCRSGQRGKYGVLNMIPNELTQILNMYQLPALEERK